VYAKISVAGARSAYAAADGIGMPSHGNFFWYTIRFGKALARLIRRLNPNVADEVR
jgi:hypothetical protein